MATTGSGGKAHGDEAHEVSRASEKHESSEKSSNRMQGSVDRDSKKELNERTRDERNPETRLSKKTAGRATFGECAIADIRICGKDTAVELKNGLPEKIQSTHENWSRDLKNPKVWHVEDGHNKFDLQADVRFKGNELTAKVKYENGREVTYKNGEASEISHPNGEKWTANPKHPGTWDVTKPNKEDPSHPHHTQIKDVKVNTADGDITWHVDRGAGKNHDREITSHNQYRDSKDGVSTLPGERGVHSGVKEQARTPEQTHQAKPLEQAHTKAPEQVHQAKPLEQAHTKAPEQVHQAKPLEQAHTKAPEQVHHAKPLEQAHAKAPEQTHQAKPLEQAHAKAPEQTHQAKPLEQAPAKAPEQIHQAERNNKVNDARDQSATQARDSGADWLNKNTCSPKTEDFWREMSKVPKENYNCEFAVQAYVKRSTLHEADSSIGPFKPASMTTGDSVRNALKECGWQQHKELTLDSAGHKSGEVVLIAGKEGPHAAIIGKVTPDGHILTLEQKPNPTDAPIVTSVEKFKSMYQPKEGHTDFFRANEQKVEAPQQKIETAHKLDPVQKAEAPNLTRAAEYARMAAPQISAHSMAIPARPAAETHPQNELPVVRGALLHRLNADSTAQAANSAEPPRHAPPRGVLLNHLKDSAAQAAPPENAAQHIRGVNTQPQSELNVNNTQAHPEVVNTNSMGRAFDNMVHNRWGLHNYASDSHGQGNRVHVYNYQELYRAAFSSNISRQPGPQLSSGVSQFTSNIPLLRRY